jgi:UDP-glucose 4-epimerase
MTAAWVIGGYGLLGTSLRNELVRNNCKVYMPPERFHWENEQLLVTQLRAAVTGYSAFAGNENSWQIYWAAGIGTMGSTTSELATETRVLSTLLDLLQAEPALMAMTGCISFASSAGAIYAGASDDVITENASDAPTTDYAHEKIKQENIVSAFAAKNHVSALIARISTLYGSGQAIGKQQGLIAEIARRILRNQSIQIYVPFDTIRDYIAADDAAAMMVASTVAISGKFAAFKKIIASEQPTSIAEIIFTYKRVARRTPRVVTCASKLSTLYKRRIQFHSVVINNNQYALKTSLLVGISQVLSAERISFARSRLE